MKLDRGSSELFVVALVTFEDHDEAEACDQAISELRQRLSLPRNFEFHYSGNSANQRRAFLETVSKFGFSHHVFGLNKARASGPGFQYKDSLYKWTARTTFENAKSYLHDAVIIIDGSGNKEFRNQLSAYLRQRINESSSPRRIKKIKIQPSHQNNLLQLADYVAGIAGRALNHHKASVAYHRQFLARHELSCRIWP